MISGSGGQSGPRLPYQVVGRLRAELGDGAEKIIRCLRTAEALMRLAAADGGDLRLAESASYNLREALNAVVEEGDHAAEGGLSAVTAAWRKVQIAAAGMPSAQDTARGELETVLAEVAADTARSSYMTRKLLSYLRARAGVDALLHRADPAAEYQELREAANIATHTQTTLADTEALEARTLAWFVRMFTPPDEVVDAIRLLAAEPWQGLHQITSLEQLITNAHHLRLFFGELADPAWLEPLRLAGIGRPSARETPWPGAALLEGLGRVQPQSVGEYLERLVIDTRSLPRDEMPTAQYELLRVAAGLGPSGYGVVAQVVLRHGNWPGVRAFAIDAALKADPADDIVMQVADGVLNDLHRPGEVDGGQPETISRSADDTTRIYDAVRILRHLQAGFTEENITQRTRMLVGKTRRLAATLHAGDLSLGDGALSDDPEEYPAPLALLAHHLVRALSTASALGVSTATQLEWLKPMPEKPGDRIRSHVLAGADDATLAEKINHVASRLTALTPTEDDLALVSDILSRDPEPGDLAAWTVALRTPSAAPEDENDPLPLDWARAWLWSAVLPEQVFTGWRDAIKQVSRVHGKPERRVLTRPRSNSSGWLFATSPISAEQLADLPVLDAAHMVAAWQPTTDRDQFFSGPLELQKTVASDLLSWTVDPAAVVATLREPIYVEHYARAVAENASEIIAEAPAVLAACLHARKIQKAAEQQERDPDQAVYVQNTLDDGILDLVKALANSNADITGSLDELWSWTAPVIRESASSDETIDLDRQDPLGDAMNSRSGRSLETILVLAAWEHRRHGTIRPEFELILDTVVEVRGAIGLEYRALLAAYRPHLETLVMPWLDAHADALFRDGPLADQTFNLTIQWAPPTLWLYEKFPSKLFDAAGRNIDNAIRQVAVAAIDGIDGYEPGLVIRRLRQTPTALASVAEDAAFLAQREQPDAARLIAAVDFTVWLLDSDPPVPVEALHGLGRWSFVKSLDDDQWAQLAVRTLAATDGAVRYAVRVADRAAAMPPSPATREILLRLLDSGVAWERHHAAQKALEVLRVSASGPVDETFHRLRTRLIDLGWHDAGDIAPDEHDE